MGRLVLVVQAPLLERQQPGKAAAAAVVRRRTRRMMRKLRLRVKTVMAMTWVLGIQVLQLMPGDGAFKDTVVVAVVAVLVLLVLVAVLVLAVEGVNQQEQQRASDAH